MPDHLFKNKICCCLYRNGLCYLSPLGINRILVSRATYRGELSLSILLCVDMINTSIQAHYVMRHVLHVVDWFFLCQANVLGRTTWNCAALDFSIFGQFRYYWLLLACVGSLGSSIIIMNVFNLWTLHPQPGHVISVLVGPGFGHCWLIFMHHTRCERCSLQQIMSWRRWLVTFVNCG